MQLQGQLSEGGSWSLVKETKGDCLSFKNQVRGEKSSESGNQR